MLARLGLSVKVVENGHQVLDVLQQNSFRLVLMDMQMPGMDGIEATRQIRRTLTATELPIIALTANTDPLDERRCIQAGMNDFLSKPFMLDRLKDGLEMHLSPLPDVRSEPFDMAILKTFIKTMGEDDLPFLRDIFSEFILEANRVRTEIYHGIQTGDIDRIGLACHSLKGSSSMIGASLLQQMSHELETLAQANKLDDLKLRLGHFEGAVNATRRGLDHEFEQLVAARTDLV